MVDTKLAGTVWHAASLTKDNLFSQVIWIVRKTCLPESDS